VLPSTFPPQAINNPLEIRSAANANNFVPPDPILFTFPSTLRSQVSLNFRVPIASTHVERPRCACPTDWLTFFGSVRSCPGFTIRHLYHDSARFGETWDSRETQGELEVPFLIGNRGHEASENVLSVPSLQQDFTWSTGYTQFRHRPWSALQTLVARRFILSEHSIMHNLLAPRRTSSYRIFINCCKCGYR
jgi:hypothetical protein